MLSAGHGRWCRTASAGVGRLGRRVRWLAWRAAPEPTCRTTACFRLLSSTSLTDSAEAAFVIHSCPGPQKIVPFSHSDPPDAHLRPCSSYKTYLSSPCRLLRAGPCLCGIPTDHDLSHFHRLTKRTARRKCSYLRPLRRLR